jgi:signal transduction histidine kinase
MKETFTFIVGEDKRLADILADADAIRLLRSAIRAGAAEAAIRDDSGIVLWSEGAGESDEQGCDIVMPIHLEGEPVGELRLRGGSEPAARLKGLAELVLEALAIILANNLKRILTTEVHTTVVNRSYEELLEINEKLSLSERKYRDLAENLEKTVGERTAELKKAHSKLLQQEKMASIGQLAAGVAHEINNPMAFIAGNLQAMQKYADRFIAMLGFYRDALAGSTGSGGLTEAAKKKWQELKLDFVIDDIPDLFRQSMEGAERVKKIVSDLKAFSHVDDAEEAPVDINAEIDKTLNVLTHRITEGTEIIRNYRPIPSFTGNPSLLCQVFLNIIVNALQARPEGLKLNIGTSCEGDRIIVAFADNGPGIPEPIRHRIFEPFYTTREVGAGTGMGLTVAYDIVSGYGGTLAVNCPEEGGSVFTATLPLKRGN